MPLQFDQNNETNKQMQKKLWKCWIGEMDAKQPILVVCLSRLIASHLFTS